ncbi:MAG: hypothetical protein ACI9U2_003168, partial [Bradymonadia bacterium]
MASRQRLGLVLGLIALAPAAAFAQAELVGGLGGPAGFGENSLPPGNHISSDEIDMLPAFPNGLRLLGQGRTSLWVNNTGSISFDGPVPVWPNADILAAPNPMAMPMWSDVDTRGGAGTVWYDIDVGRMVMTWDAVGRFDQQAAPTNSFQVVVTDRSDLNPGDFDITFRYSDCNWFLADDRPGVEPARPNLMLCGNSVLPIAAFTDMPVIESCVPDADTQAMFITRSGANAFDDAQVQAYVEAGGIVIGEFAASDNIFNAVFDEAVVQAAARTGSCRDNVNPVVRQNLGDPFWQALDAYPTQAANFSGCGYSVDAYPGITALGGWDADTTSLAYRERGNGRVWFVEADWADGSAVVNQDPRFFNAASQAIMRYMILNGVGAQTAFPAQAGFAAGDGSNAIRLPGSGTPAVLDLCNGSNVDDPGVWESNVRFGFFTLCGDGSQEFGEFCDDGNRLNGDGCDQDCRVEVDDDGDGVSDNTDNCPEDANPDQADLDADGLGDVCDFDDDADDVLDVDDNCPVDANPGQLDTDNDGAGDACDADDDGDGIDDDVDNCPLASNANQADLDGDGLGNPCDADRDGDGVANATDNCPSDANPDQADLDGDGTGDVCDPDDDGDGVNDGADNCPVDANANQADLDGDGAGDACDADDDGDGVDDAADNCPVVVNANQADLDGDGAGDLCDADDDGDGVNDGADNCPLDANADQTDTDDDGLGDTCDPDDDNDGARDENDNCPLVANPLQADLDGDGMGDVCDDDIDNDRVPDANDNCPALANPDQADLDGDDRGDVCDADDDGDGVPDAADNCPRDVNADQADLDADGAGDACDADEDGDGVNDDADNCPRDVNANQADLDADGAGDVCDPDDDGDGVNDNADNCPVDANPVQTDTDGDGA